MSYSYLNFQAAVNEGIHGKISSVIDVRGFLNRSVRKLNSAIDIRSTKRTSSLAPGIYNQVTTYPAPADLKDDAIVDIRKQYDRVEEFNLTTAENFDRRKSYDKSSIAVDDRDGVKVLNIATELNTDETTINACDSLTGNGTFVAADDASNITLDTYNKVNGSASIKYDLGTGAILATITNSTMTAVDLTEYNNREIFVWQYIPLTTLLTSFTIRWGTGASDYWTATATTTADGLAFKVGWNLLRFSWPTTDTGTPDITAVNYFQLRINKTALMAASNDWRTDFIVARAGDIHDVIYYSRYFWTTAAGVYIPDSTADTDLLVADEEDFELLVKCAMDTAGQPARLEVLERRENKEDYTDAIETYRMNKPSERKVNITSYHDFGSIDGDVLPGIIRTENSLND
jgi:hypothetical protein